MNVTAQKNKTSDVLREERHRTHILAELKKYKWIPFISTYSGVVMDINSNGVKVAFPGEIDVRPHTLYTIRIPLSPLGMSEPRYFECSFEVKWFDTRNYRLGGLFVNLSEQQRLILNSIVEATKKLTEKRNKNPLRKKKSQ